MKESYKYLLLTVIFCFLGARSLAAPGDILGQWPTPCRTPTGLAFDGKNLWLADRLSDSLFCLERESGLVVRKLPAPSFAPLGLAWDGKHLWCVDYEQKRICMMDVQSGLTLRSFESPTPGPQGLAWDGKDLWLADDSKDVLCKISTDDGTTIVTFPAPSDATTGLTYWNGYLWCADRKDDKIYLFDPEHGEVVFALDAPGKFARGLATDGKVLWCVDYQDDVVYELVLEGGQQFKTANPRRLELLLTHEFRNYGPGDVPVLDVYLAVPSDLPNQKLLQEVEFTPQPLEFVADEWGQRVAHFRREHLALAQRVPITMRAVAELSEVRWFVYPHRVGMLKDIPEDIRRAYLADAEKYCINDPLIQKAAKDAVGDEKNPYWMMRRLHKYVREHLSYELSGGWNVAPEVLRRGNGSCSEYTFVFIALCRAAGLPARYVGSVVVRGDDASTDETFHRWAQVYLPGYGWVHVDAQAGDKEKPADVAKSIGTVDNRFLITTAGGGPSRLLGWGYNYQHTWTARGPVKIHEEAVGEWSPLEPSKR